MRLVKVQWMVNEGRACLLNRSDLKAEDVRVLRVASVCKRHQYDQNGTTSHAAAIATARSNAVALQLLLRQLMRRTLRKHSLEPAWNLGKRFLASRKTKKVQRSVLKIETNKGSSN